MNKIILENVKKFYNSQEVLRGISLTIEQGSFVSVMGESGSGKSTLLGVMSGISAPTEGTVLYDDCDIYALNDSKRAAMRTKELGIVYQFFNLIPTLTVEDNILLPLYLRKELKSEAKERLAVLTEQLRIDDILKKYPKKISGGQQQRAAICRALIYNPDFLFLDEPTGNLDSDNTKTIMTLLRDISSERGVTVVQVTHSQETACYGNRVIKIKDGLVIGDENIF